MIVRRRCWGTFEPASPFHVGPVDFVPSTVWHPVQLKCSAAFLPAATAAGVTATVGAAAAVAFALSLSSPYSSPVG